MLRALVTAVFLFAAAGAQAAPTKHKSVTRKVARDPRTEGLGRNCKQTSDCKHRGQRCIKEVDANGKPLAAGFCVLPCASFEAGTTKVVPGAQVDVSKKSKKPPPRCPPKYQCRSAGAGVPIDMCVKE
jgi:hypothetical protein